MLNMERWRSSRRVLSAGDRDLRPSMSSADVVIVGGGIVGCATAYYLARQQMRSLIVERDAIAGHASGLAYGGLNPLSGAGIPGPMFPLAQRSFELHVALAKEFECGFRQRPTLHLALTAEDEQRLDTEFNWAAQQSGFDVERLNAMEARRLEPRLSDEVRAANLLSGTAEVDPHALTKALAEASGAEVHIANAIDMNICGDRAVGVRTASEAIACGAVVLAQGPWPSLPSWNEGQTATPVAPLKGEILRLAASGAPVAQSIGWQGNYLTTKPDGLLWAGTTEQQAGFDATPIAVARDEILGNLKRLMPGLTDTKIVRQTACLRPMSADGLALLGRAPNLANVYMANGGGRKGVLYGPAMGCIVADLLATGSTDMDVSAYRPERFDDPQ